MDELIRFIVPTFNEERAIAELLGEIQRVMAGRPFEIIHVDDGSTDRTSEIVAEARSCGIPVSTIRHPKNLGIGQTFRDGLDACLRATPASGVVILLEGDMTNDPSRIPELIRLVEQGNDIVIASRYRPGSAQPGFPFKRKLMSWVLNRVLLNAFVGLEGVRDYSIFYRAYSGKFLQQAWLDEASTLITCDGFGANAEPLCKLGRKGARVCEISQVYDYGRCEGNSSISIVRTIGEYLRLFNSLRKQ